MRPAMFEVNCVISCKLKVVDRKETDGILRMRLNRLKLFCDTSSFHCWRAILPQMTIVVRY